MLIESHAQKLTTLSSLIIIVDYRQFLIRNWSIEPDEGTAVAFSSLSWVRNST